MLKSNFFLFFVTYWAYVVFNAFEKSNFFLLVNTFWAYGVFNAAAKSNFFFTLLGFYAYGVLKLVCVWPLRLVDLRDKFDGVKNFCCVWLLLSSGMFICNFLNFKLFGFLEGITFIFWEVYSLFIFPTYQSKFKGLKFNDY